MAVVQCFHRILIVDDHAVTRRGLTAFLNLQPDMQVVAEACDGLEAIDLVRQHRPDVILMDALMPRMNGLEATHIICQEFPLVTVLFFTLFPYEPSATHAGAKTSLLKDCRSDELLEAIRSFGAGTRSDEKSVDDGKAPYRNR